MKKFKIDYEVSNPLKADSLSKHTREIKAVTDYDAVAELGQIINRHYDIVILSVMEVK